MGMVGRGWVGGWLVGTHGTYMRWYLRKVRTISGEISVIWSVEGVWLDREESEIGILPPKRPIFLYTCATYSKLSSNISTHGSIQNKGVYNVHLKNL